MINQVAAATVHQAIGPEQSEFGYIFLKKNEHNWVTNWMWELRERET